MSETRLEKFLADVADEVRRSEYHGPITSLHHGYAVILEELDECWDEIKKKEVDAGRLYFELVQVAAMVAKTARDVLP